MSQPGASRVPLIRIRDLRFRYSGALHESLRIPALDVMGTGLTAIMGPSGAGKTTLVELVAGTLREPYEGTIEVLGVDWNDLRRDSDRQRQLRRIGLIPQDYALLPGRTVREILQQDLADGGVPRGEQEVRIRRALSQVGLDAFAERESNRLSGGQRQRVAIARMLARDVDLVIADEPTANLDPELVEETVDMLRTLSKQAPVVVVTHDARVAALCDRTLLLQLPASPHVPASSERRSEGRSRGRALALGAVAALALLAVGALGVKALSSQGGHHKAVARTHPRHRVVRTALGRPSAVPRTSATSVTPGTAQPTLVSTASGASSDQLAAQQAVTNYHVAVRQLQGPGHSGSLEGVATGTARAAIMCGVNGYSNSLVSTDSYYTYDPIAQSFGQTYISGDTATVVENRHETRTLHNPNGSTEPYDDDFTVTYTLTKGSSGWLVSDYAWTSPDGTSGSATNDAAKCP